MSKIELTSTTKLSELAELESPPRANFAKFHFGRKQRSQGKNTTPLFGNDYPIELKFGMHKLEVLTQLSTQSTRPRNSPSPGLLAPEVTQVDPPTNPSAKHGIISCIIFGMDSLRDLKTFAHLFGTLRRV